MIDLILFRNGL